MDDLVNYEFMEEVHQELFDGSTSGKTLKDAGIDFDQRLNLFYGKTNQNEISGFTFGVKNKAQLFDVFDDNEIYLNISRINNIFMWSLAENQFLDPRIFNSRKEAELAAIAKAFELLEDKITPIEFPNIEDEAVNND